MPSRTYSLKVKVARNDSPAVTAADQKDRCARCGEGRGGSAYLKPHAARHTCATLMHLSGVAVAVIAAWIGHKDASLTMRLYAHSQADALKSAGATLDRVVSPLCH